MWTMGFDEVVDLTKAAGFETIIVPISDDEPKGPSFADAIATIDEETFANKVSAKIRRSQHHWFVISLLRGDFEKLKHACLYVDLDLQTGNVAGASFSVDRRMSDKALRLASGAIWAVEERLVAYDRREKYLRDREAAKTS